MKKAATMLALLCVAIFAQQNGSFTDPRDKKTYKTVKIGEQVWMAENLNYKMKGSKCFGEGSIVSDGSIEDDGSLSEPLETLTKAAVQANCRKYGQLYDWNTAINACPKGWHLPSDNEWDTLIKAVGDSSEAGTKLKAKNSWNDYVIDFYFGGKRSINRKSGNGTDIYGFSALPGGYYSKFYDAFFTDGKDGFWWSATEDSSNKVYYQVMNYNRSSVRRHGGDFKSELLSSVRCLQDSEKSELNKNKEETSIEEERNANVEDTTKSSDNYFTDPRDDKIYKTVKIGEQTWMAKNLDYTGKNYDIGSCYDKNPENCEKYGALYNWNEAMKVCPSGWHLPSKAEWKELTDFVGGDSIAGKKLKAKNGWIEYKCKYTVRDTTVSNRGKVTVKVKEHDKCATDEFGFSALPGGHGELGGRLFGHVRYVGYWWSASVNVSSKAYYRNMGYNSEFTFWADDGSKSSDLFSVRCVQDGEDKTFYENEKSHIETNDGSGSKLGGLMSGGAGVGTKARGSLKAPSARDIDMGDGGSRSKAEIMAVVNARMPGLRNIYNKYLMLKQGFNGKVTLKFTIAPSGDIVSIATVSSTTGYSEFDNAVKNMVGTWKWKAIQGGNTTPTIPFNFTE